MLTIETINDAYRQKLTSFTDAATQTFRKAVRPIYASKDGTRPLQIGSCILLEVDGRNFVVTAAHVADEMPELAEEMGASGNDHICVG